MVKVLRGSRPGMKAVRSLYMGFGRGRADVRTRNHLDAPIMGMLLLRRCQSLKKLF